MNRHHFISYYVADAEDFAWRLCDALTAGPPSLPMWLDKRELEARQYVGFTCTVEPALARLRTDLQLLASPAGVLQELKYRRADAQGDLRRANDDAQRTRIQDDIAPIYSSSLLPVRGSFPDGVKTHDFQSRNLSARTNVGFRNLCTSSA